jgi:serine/threonine protein kinase
MLKVFCGTPSYMAPEITKKRDYEGNPVDIWACGVLLYVMLAGQFPFRGTSEQDLY